MKGNKSWDTEKQRKLIEHKTYSIAGVLLIRHSVLSFHENVTQF